ncbi:MAG TPA: hypothetical protein DCF62_10255 [Porticoccaceae bacterium]|nr:hypothetical protein [Porticoccaceae bacterium]HCO59230.1 hypothetical protein [Porticoccaceae bacterium]
MSGEDFDNDLNDGFDFDNQDDERNKGEVISYRQVDSVNKRRLLEERLAQRQLEKQISDYDFELL